MQPDTFIMNNLPEVRCTSKTQPIIKIVDGMITANTTVRFLLKKFGVE